jgi:hypothetical protein
MFYLSFQTIWIEIINYEQGFKKLKYLFGVLNMILWIQFKNLEGITIEER